MCRDPVSPEQIKLRKTDLDRTVAEHVSHDTGCLRRLPFTQEPSGRRSHKIRNAQLFAHSGSVPQRLTFLQKAFRPLRLNLRT